MDSVVRFLIKLQADKGNALSAARSVTDELDRVRRGADSVGASLRKAFSPSNFKKQLEDIPGVRLLANPYTAIAAGVGAVTKLGAEAEKTSAAFRVLVGDERRAASLLGEINEFAAATPFSKLDLERAAQTMLNFGVPAGEVMTRLRQLGDISMGDAQKLGSLALVFGQVSAATKLNGQDLQQFIGTGFNPLKVMAEATGKSYGELQEAMSAGGISASAVAEAMAKATGAGGQFHGMMEATAQTLSGKWSTALGAVQQSATELFAEIKPAVLAAVSVFQTLAEAVIAAAGALLRLRDYILAAAAGVAAFAAALNAGKIAVLAYGALLKGMAALTKAWAAAQTLLNFVLTANPIGLVVALIAGLAAAGAVCWQKFAGFRAFLLTMWETVKGFGDTVKTYLIDRFNSLLEGAGKLGKALSALFKGDFKGAWGAAADGLKDISGAAAAEKAAASVKRLAGGAGATYSSILAEERRKDATEGGAAKRPSLSAPGVKGSAPSALSALSPAASADGGKGKRGKGGGKAAEALATGGTRTTNITITIGKFFDAMNVSMADRTDTAELERAVVRCMNRALATASGADR